MNKTSFIFKTLIFIIFAVVVANIFWFFKLNRVNTVPQHYDTVLSNIKEQGIQQNALTRKNQDLIKFNTKNFPISREIIIASVACGDRASELLIMMKSAVILSREEKLRFILFADDSVSSVIREEIELWPAHIISRFNLDLHPIQLPESGRTNEWKKLFKPCASQRLFLPSLLKNIDSLLYMDTDTLFLTSPMNVWEHFRQMNTSQMAALAPEHEDYATGWYNRFARHPYYGNLGVNSGVMLMNLTRMRKFDWEKYVIPIYHEYKAKITWGDQDIINILFHFHPEKLYVYPCNFNFRPDHCMYTSVCNSAEKMGVHVLHGNRGSFHNEKQPSFRSVYKTIEEYQFDDDTWTNLLVPMKEKLQETVETNCGKVSHILTKALEKQLQNWQKVTDRLPV